MCKVLRLSGFFSTLIFFFGLPFESIAQDDYQEGYVVTNANDTLYGMVRDRKTGAFGKLYKKIKFKGKRGKSRYAPKEIKSYKIGDITFESMPLISAGHFFDVEYEVSPRGDFQFLKVVEKGYLSYYQLEYEDSDSGYVDNTAFFKKENGNILVRVNQGIFGLKRKKLAAFFIDCPELAERIRTKQIKDAMEIIHFYNDWKSNE